MIQPFELIDTTVASTDNAFSNGDSSSSYWVSMSM